MAARAAPAVAYGAAPTTAFCLSVLGMLAIRCLPIANSVLQKVGHVKHFVLQYLYANPLRAGR